MVQIARRIWGVAVFVGAIFFGMHVAGQTPGQAGAPANAAALGLPPGSEPNSAALTAILNANGSAAPGAPTSAMPDPASANAGASPPSGALGNPAPSAAGNMPGTGASPEPPGQTNPAFGPGAAKAADAVLNKMDNETQAHNPRATPARFVPSEVETVISGQVKVGDPRAVLHTSLGDITVHLFSAYAPRTVRNFIDLARGDKEFFDIKTGKGVHRPFYTNLLFHRVISGFLIQTGCPFGNGRGGPGFTIPDEISPVLRFNKAGILAMASERKDSAPQKDTNGSQFFITLGAMPEWDDKYTIFGEVERGMNIVTKIGQTKTGPTDRPIKRIFLYSVEIFDEATANALKDGSKIEPAKGAGAP